MIERDEALLHEPVVWNGVWMQCCLGQATDDDRNERLALIDDLKSLRQRLLEAKEEVADALRLSEVSRSATSAYGRANRLRQ